MFALKLAPRDRHEQNRVSTTLELMFDLASVIAIAVAARGLHHGIAEGHTLEALPGFLAGFFAVWWSWMNYTWFASAYDNASPAFRVLTMAAMFGALAIAAGIPAVFSGDPIYLCVLGFVIMRVAMAALWFAAAAGDATHRRSALTYGFGILVMQVVWVTLALHVPPASPLYAPLFALAVLGELLVPVIAELGHGATNWHRHHIMERYGLLNIIVLGECFLSISAMLTTDGSGAPASPHDFLMAGACALITFSLWGVYFTNDEHLENDALPRALLWGYGHFAIFAAGAATGAGFAVFHDVASGEAHVSYASAAWSIAVPVAIYLAMLWLVRDRFSLNGWKLAVLPLGAATVLLCPLLATSDALIFIALAMVITAALRRSVSARAHTGL